MNPAASLLAVDFFEHVIDSYHLTWLENFEFLGFHLPHWLSKFMLLQLVAAGLILAIYLPIGRAARSGRPPRGFIWNTFEVLLTFVRDQIAKPSIGEGEADRYVPFLWTVFLYVLFCNLLGMFPGLGSPTGALAVTAVLALFAFVVIHGSAIRKLGLVGYAKAQVPHGMNPFIAGFVTIIEVLSHFIKGSVLAIRLFSNMFAGHLALAAILGFIAMAKFAGWYTFWPITLGSVVLALGVSMLELFVAFLQAYVFTFLTSLFLGMALHPHH
jgi:F-type H+-transporting ATPase subunit a